MTPDYTFYVDAPLKRLSRWIRILGYECYYCPSLSVRHQVFPRSLNEQSIVLTRQPSLYKKLQSLEVPYRVIFISENNWQDQIQQLIFELELKKPTMKPAIILRGKIIKLKIFLIFSYIIFSLQKTQKLQHQLNHHLHIE